jgi:hypothetical protein
MRYDSDIQPQKLNEGSQQMIHPGKIDQDFTVMLGSESV